MPGKRENQEALLHKVDALLKRHRSGATRAGTHALADIPVLTDMVDDEKPLPAPAVSATDPARSARPTDLALEGLAGDIFERVLEKLDDRIAAQFETRLTSQIKRAIDSTLLQVGTDLKQDLMNSVSDAIAEALAEKLSGVSVPLSKST